MPTLLWDASALAKRYYAELGSATVDAIFSMVPLATMIATFWGYAESYASLLRKHNRGIISGPALRAAVALLESEVLQSPNWILLTVENASVLSGIDLVRKHNLNTADAAILATYLGYIQSQPLGSPQCVLVAADQRLLRAAAAEGLPTLNPEAVPAADIPALLASY